MKTSTLLVSTYMRSLESNCIYLHISITEIKFKWNASASESEFYWGVNHASQHKLRNTWSPWSVSRDGSHQNHTSLSMGRSVLALVLLFRIVWLCCTCSMSGGYWNQRLSLEVVTPDTFSYQRRIGNTLRYPSFTKKDTKSNLTKILAELLMSYTIP